MRIDKAEIIVMKLPIKIPFTVSFGTMSERVFIIIKLFNKDYVGYGECASFQYPSYVPEFTQGEKLVLKDYLLPQIVGKSFETAEEISKALQNIKGHKFAKAAVESSFWHLLSQQENKSLQELFGGTQSKINVGSSIGIQDSREKTVKEVFQAIKKGYKRQKIKIKQGWDREVIKTLRLEFPDEPLMIDGNSDYRVEHSHIFQEMDQYNLMMLEQPLAFDDLVDHAELQKDIKTPICLDESIRSAEDARKAIQIGSCQNINIKPGRVGGPLETIAIHDLMEKNNKPVWCGGLLETGIGRAFNIALASLPNFKLPADMSEPLEFYHEDTVKDSYTIVNGEIKVRTTPGLGFEVDESIVQKYTLESLTISTS